MAARTPVCYTQYVKLQILTLFPEVIQAYLQVGVLARARQNDVFNVETIQLRDFATKKYASVDDAPYGGGAGLVMSCEPLYNAWQAACSHVAPVTPHTIAFSPAGKPFRQADAQRLASQEKPLVLVCGRYEGIDERFLELCVDEEFSMGDYVLTGGEIPALALIDACARLLPGAIGNAASPTEESFQNDLLEYPQYTRPEEFQGKHVPSVLLSGNHAAIKEWRQKQARERTLKRRPDLLGKKA